MRNRVGSYALLAAALLAFFVIGTVSAYQPIAGLAIVAAIAFFGSYYAKPTWFANLVIFVTCFGGLLHLPVTDDGFSSAVALALPALCLQVAGLMVRKDRHLVRVFAGRFDQLLPLVLMLAMFISVKNSREIGHSLRALQQWFYIVAIFYFIVLVVREPRHLHHAVLAFLIGGFIVELLGVRETVLNQTTYEMTDHRSLLGADLSKTLVDVEEPGRINGPAGDPPFHGIFCTATAALSLYVLFTARHKAVKAFCVLVLVLAIYNVMGTGSRGALLSLALAIFIFWLVSDIPNKARYLIVGGSIFVVMVVAFVIVVSSKGGEARAVTYNSDTSDTTEMRIKNFPVALKMFADYPIFGIGPDGFVSNFSRYAVGVSNLASRTNVQKTHDTPLQVAAENGLVGLSVFLAAFGTGLARALAAARRAQDPRHRILGAALFAGLTAYAFFMLTSNSLLDKFMWILVAFAQTLHSLSFFGEKGPDETPASPHTTKELLNAR